MLVVLLAPAVNEEEDPREAQDEIANELAGPVPCKIFETTLKIDAPESHGEVEEDAALGEKVLKVFILDKGNHE